MCGPIQEHKLWQFWHFNSKHYTLLNHLILKLAQSILNTSKKSAVVTTCDMWIYTLPPYHPQPYLVCVCLSLWVSEWVSGREHSCLPPITSKPALWFWRTELSFSSWHRVGRVGSTVFRSAIEIPWSCQGGGFNSLAPHLHICFLKFWSH